MSCLNQVAEDPEATPGPITSLRIEPQDAILAFVEPGPVTQEYRAFAVHADGVTEEEVTADVVWGIDDIGLGLFVGNRFEAYGTVLGASTIRARLPSEQLDGATTVTVRIEISILAEGAPANSETLFEGEETGTAPEIRYPNDGVILPPNLRPVDVHWLRGGSNNLFEVRYESEILLVRVFTPCIATGNGCAIDLPEEAIEVLTFYTPLASPGTKHNLTVRGLDSAGLGNPTVGVSTPIEVGFSSSPIQGALYYWKANPGSIMRVDVGATDPTPQSYYTPMQTGGLCIGCHAVSRDGTKMAVGLSIPMPSQMQSLDIASTSIQFTGMSNFFGYSPDGAVLTYSTNGSLMAADGTTGDLISPTPIALNADMPEWSADGLTVVFSRPGQDCIPWLTCNIPGVDAGSLLTVSYDPNTRTFGSEQVLTTAVGGANHYYPTVSPDSNWVLYNRSMENSYDAPDASLWMVDINGGAPLELQNADDAHANSWPKWAPFLNAFGDEELMWVAFSSRRDYGLKLINSAQPGDDQTPQLWMAAVTPGVAPDPSHAAFWLPYQNINSGNHIPQWAEEIVGDPAP